MVGDAFHLSFGIQTALSELNRQNAMDGLSCLFEAWLSEQYTWVLRAKWSLEMWFIIYRGVTIQIHFFVQVSFTENFAIIVCFFNSILWLEEINIEIFTWLNCLSKLCFVYNGRWICDWIDLFYILNIFKKKKTFSSSKLNAFKVVKL